MDFIFGIAVGMAVYWGWVKFGKPIMDKL